MRSWIAIAVLAGTACLPAAAHSAAAPVPAPVEARVPLPPAVFVGSDGARHLAYEIHVRNVYEDTGPLTFDSLDVSTADGAQPLLHLDRAALAAWVRPAPKHAAPATVGAGKQAVIRVWITLDSAAPNPTGLRHRIGLSAGRRAMAVDGVVVAVDQRPVPVLGPPLRGGTWLAHEGPGAAQSHHWGSLVAVNGSLTIPQRFAIDFVGVDAAGHALRSIPRNLQTTQLDDWVGHGADVLAVADGDVVAVRDGEPEHRPLSPQPEPTSLSADGLFGNYVVLAIGPHQFAAYAHLARGSVAVQLGDRVHKGQTLARLGQSGNAAAPHLHFQLADAATFEGSEGMPYVLSAFEVRGSETESQLFGIGPAWRSTGSEPRREQLPLNGTVVAFPP